MNPRYHSTGGVQLALAIYDFFNLYEKIVTLPVESFFVSYNFGYSLDLSIVNNFESDKSLILGANLNPNRCNK